jgi:hypothetical protein
MGRRPMGCTVPVYPGWAAQWWGAARSGGPAQPLVTRLAALPFVLGPKDGRQMSVGLLVGLDCPSYVACRNPSGPRLFVHCKVLLTLLYCSSVDSMNGILPSILPTTTQAEIRSHILSPCLQEGYSRLWLRVVVLAPHAIYVCWGSGMSIVNPADKSLTSGGYNRLWHRVVVPVPQALYRLGGWYVNPADYIPQSGTKKLATCLCRCRSQ